MFACTNARLSAFFLPSPSWPDRCGWEGSRLGSRVTGSQSLWLDFIAYGLSASPGCCPIPSPVVYHPSLSRGFLSVFVYSVMAFSFVSGCGFSVCICLPTFSQLPVFSLERLKEQGLPQTIQSPPPGLASGIFSLFILQAHRCPLVELKPSSQALYCPTTALPFTASDPVSQLSGVEPLAFSPSGLLQESSGCGVLRKRLRPVSHNQ